MIPLDADRLPGYLRSRGLLAPGEPVEVTALAGGVSNVVLAYTTPSGGGVVKQALSRLRVAAEWTADVRRTRAEAAALRLCARLTPTAVPAVLQFDEQELILIVARAEPTHRTWKAALLANDVSPAVAETLGRVLGTWHASTDGVVLSPDLGGATAESSFEELRIRPYHRAVSAAHPDLADSIDSHLSAMRQRRRCLVHGDFSPKNVLVGADWVWVIDHEVAHLGDPAFDLAFLIHHLMLKAIHRQQAAAAFADCVDEFLTAYEETVPASLRPDAVHLGRHVGCLLLARVDGASPAEYLDGAGRAAARELGRRLLLKPPDRIEGLLP